MRRVHKPPAREFIVAQVVRARRSSHERARERESERAREHRRHSGFLSLQKDFLDLNFFWREMSNVNNVDRIRHRIHDDLVSSSRMLIFNEDKHLPMCFECCIFFVKRES